jgi:hypothetical protein
MPAKGHKKESDRKLVSARIPDYIYNTIIDYAKRNNCTTSRAVEDILAGGINFLMMMDDNESE